MSGFPHQNERLFDRPRKASRRRGPAGPAVAWIALVLAAAAITVSAIGTSRGAFGLTGTEMSYAAVAAIIVALVIAVIAVRRRAQPRWAAMTALVMSLVAILPTLGLIILTAMFLFAFLVR